MGNNKTVLKVGLSVNWFCLFVVAFSEIFLASVSRASESQLGRVMPSFDFHKYDKITEREQKNAAASHDLNDAFPAGYPVKILLEYIDNLGGHCEKRQYVPPQDRMAFPVGGNIYCETSYPLPSHAYSIFRVRWSIGINYEESTRVIRKINVFSEIYGLGG